MRDLAILTAIFSFTFGILVSSLVFISPLASIFIITTALAVLWGEKLYQNNISPEVLIIFLFLISFSLGSLRYAVKDFYEPTTPLTEGVVVSEAEQKDNATRFILLSDNGEKTLVSTGIYEDVRYGDRVILSGVFKRPGVIVNEDSGRNFDYAAYLAKDDIYHTMSFAEIEVIGSGEGNPIKHMLFRIKRMLVGKMKEVFPEPHASLLAGLVVSGRDAMPQNILEDFRRAGIIHIVVLSGYNVTIIADFLRKFFEKIFLATHFTAVPALASGASIVGIILFVLMTGAEATVVRASIMVLTVILAKMLGRQYSAPRALLLAGFLMLLENPKILVFDPSFQLSFLATLALIYVVPMVEKSFHWITDRWSMRSIVATTLGTQLTVLPLLVYSVGDLSLVSLPANILILLIIPYVMLLGFVATLLSYIGFIIALPFAYPAHILLSWILEVSNFFGNMSFASIAVPSVSIWIIALIYLLLACLIVLKNRLKLYPENVG